MTDACVRHRALLSGRGLLQLLRFICRAGLQCFENRRAQRLAVQLRSIQRIAICEKTPVCTRVHVKRSAAGGIAVKQRMLAASQRFA